MCGVDPPLWWVRPLLAVSFPSLMSLYPDRGWGKFHHASTALEGVRALNQQ